MPFKFEIVIPGKKLTAPVFYRQTKEAGIAYGKRKITDIVSKDAASANVECLIYVLEREENQKFGWVETVRFCPADPNEQKV